MGRGSFGLITQANQISAENVQTPLRKDQVIGSIQFTKPVTDVPAIGHYRLIYESPTTVAEDETHQIKEVKIFERVKGYTFAGNGTIELPVITNQGRTFTWRQQSTNGTFTLPYSTQNNPYDVRATGPYRIVETGKTIEVSEIRSPDPHTR
jgi:dolichyl-diphosphooligosaccharide--protein glycosyltransferase